jgi:hypothetical protein
MAAPPFLSTSLSVPLATGAAGVLFQAGSVASGLGSGRGGSGGKGLGSPRGVSLTGSARVGAGSGRAAGDAAAPGRTWFGCVRLRSIEEKMFSSSASGSDGGAGLA